MKLTISRLSVAAAIMVSTTAAFAAEEAPEAINTVASAEAIVAYDAATDALWEKLPLSFRHVLFADEVTAYGRYTLRTNSTFDAGDTATIYVEPVGYGFSNAEDGNSVSLEIAIDIRTPGGLVLGRTEDFASLTWSGQARSREVHGAISLPLPELKAGAYEIMLQLSDEASGKIARAVLPFSIRQPDTDSADADQNGPEKTMPAEQGD